MCGEPEDANHINFSWRETGDWREMVDCNYAVIHVGNVEV